MRQKRLDHADVIQRLDRLRPVPDDTLTDLVTRDGLCMWAYRREDMPRMTARASTDQALAFKLCAGCPVQDECLELELRTAGPHTVGVWGALSEADRRQLYREWAAHRKQLEGAP